MPSPASAIPASWAEMQMARVIYNYRGDQRRGSDYSKYRINDDGIIDGQEFANLVRVPTFADFEAALRAQGVQGKDIDDRDLYRKYLAQASDETMAILVLSRILDHEAMKRKMAPEVLDERVDYFMRAVFTQAAVSLRKIRVREEQVEVKGPSRRPEIDFCEPGGKAIRTGVITELHAAEDVSLRSNEEMYAWLKEVVKGGKGFCLNMFWRYDEGGMARDLAELRQGAGRSRSEDLNWPSVGLGFTELPGTWREFRAQIKAKLQPIHRRLLREAIFHRLMLERNPLLTEQSMFAVTTDQMDRMYAATKDSRFRVDRFRSSFLELSIRGEKAEEFQKKFIERLAQLEKEHDADFYVDPAATTTLEDDRSRMMHVAELRRRVPTEIYDALVAEYAQDIAEGRLYSSKSDLTLERASTDPFPSDDSWKSQVAQAAFNPWFANMSLFAHMMMAEKDGTIRVMLLQSLDDLKPTYLERSSKEVEKPLRGLVQQKVIGKAYRQLAYDLLRENQVEILNDTCGQLPEWPCQAQNARRWAEAAFSETLFPGMSLPSGEPARPAMSSTLGDDRYFDRVQEISLALLPRLLEVSNDH